MIHHITCSLQEQTHIHIYVQLTHHLEKKINYITLKTQTTLILCYRHYGSLTLKHDGPLTLKSIKVNISLSTDIMEFSNQTISYWGFIIFDIPLDSHFKVFLILNLVTSKEIFIS